MMMIMMMMMMSDRGFLLLADPRNVIVGIVWHPHLPIDDVHDDHDDNDNDDDDNNDDAHNDADDNYDDDDNLGHLASVLPLVSSKQGEKEASPSSCPLCWFVPGHWSC